jgi:hypothetical protein
MQPSEQVIPSNTPLEAPLVCPVCCDHEIERIDGIVLSARPMGDRDLSEAAMFRCRHWHLSALVYQAAEWEQV